MDEVEKAGILTPETIDAINSYRDSLQFMFEPEDGEVVVEGGKCCIKDCSNIDRIKLVLCDVKIDLKDCECTGGHHKERTECLRKQPDIEEKEREEEKECKQRVKDDIESLVKEFALKSKQIRSICKSLSRHEQMSITLDTKIAEKIKVYETLPGPCRECLFPSLKKYIECLKRRLHNEQVSIRKVENALSKKLEYRNHVAKVINEETDGVFTELFKIYHFTKKTTDNKNNRKARK